MPKPIVALAFIVLLVVLFMAGRAVGEMNRPPQPHHPQVVWATGETARCF